MNQLAGKDGVEAPATTASDLNGTLRCFRTSSPGFLPQVLSGFLPKVPRGFLDKASRGFVPMAFSLARLGTLAFRSQQALGP